MRCEEGEDAGIEIAAARAHDEPFARREAHRGIHRAPVIDRAERRAVAEMAAHDFQLARTPLQKLRRRQRHVAVRRTVEAVAPHALLLVKLVRQTVEIRVARQRRVKRRVEHRDVRRGGEDAARLANAGDVHRIVQRRERTERLDLREHRVVDQHRAR